MIMNSSSVMAWSNISRCAINIARHRSSSVHVVANHQLLVAPFSTATQRRYPSAHVRVGAPRPVRPDAALTDKDLPFKLRSNLKQSDEKETPTEMLKREIEEYNTGKRWLARMMGADPETFTQEDVNASIEYLLPSHLFAKDARPKMDHPENMYVELLNAASKVNDEGRPFEAAFYTAQPNYYNVTFEVWEAIEKLDTAEPAQIKEVVQQNDDQDIFWMTKAQLEKHINEQISDKQYSDVLNRWKRLASHPRASLVQDVLSKFSVPLQRSGSTSAVLERVELDAGEARAEGRCKTAMAEVFVREGSGQVRVNGKHLNEFFKVDGAQQQVAYPLLVTGDLFTFDIDGYVMGGGYSGQAGAMRLAISRAIVGLHPEKQPLLDAAGLLRQDMRRKERKKPGKARARKKYAWKRR